MRVKGGSGGLPWGTFAAVCTGYLAVTVGESVLAPLYPVVAEDLGADIADAGLALGLATGSIAVANVAGGHLLARFGPRRPILLALGLVAIGGMVSTLATALPAFLLGQVLLGLAAGTFFAPGIQTAGLLGGTSRRGLVMGIFGVAFSGGLAVAALLGAAGSQVGWRSAYVAVAALGVVGMVLVAKASLPVHRAEVPGRRWSARELLGRATAVGSAAAVSQYGTVAFFPLFAVEVWGMSAGAAALLLAVARVASVPTKTIAGHLSDAHGPMRTLRGLAVALAALGALWTLAPGPAWGAVPAVAFAATVSGVFPIANLLALDEMAERGALLGAYRSVQMGVGAAAAAAIGFGAASVGLRPTLVVTLLAPVALLLTTTRGPAGAEFPGTGT